MKKINAKFIAGMLAMALVFGMAGCDEVLNEPGKGTDTEVTGYGVISLDQSAVTCIVVFDPQGGDMGVVPKGNVGEVKIYVPSGEKATKPSPDPTKAGYTFGGWYTDTACKSLYDFNATVTTDFTVYANWEPNPSDVFFIFTFDPQGGDMGNVPKGNVGQVKIYVQPGEKATKPSPDPTKAGYTFGGWYTDTTFKSLYDFDTPVKANFTVYANWVPNPCKVDYSLNGAPGTPPYPPGYVTYGQTLTEPAAPQWTDHIFIGWFKDAAGTGTAWNFKTDTVTATMTLYAKWTLGEPVPGINTFTDAIDDMKNHVNDGKVDYTLESGSEDYGSYTLTARVNCPLNVVIDGRQNESQTGRVVNGDGNIDGIVVGAGITLTLKNITFNNLKFTVDGTLVLGDGVFMSGNGGGSRVSVRYGGVLEMSGTAHITQGNYGGVALGPWGSGSVPPKFTMKGGKITDANGQGGVFMLAPNSEFTMSGGEISNNYCSMGGGVRIEGQGSKFTMSGGLISGNSAGNYGGGVILWGADTVFTMSGGTISGNNTAAGGGVALTGNNSKFTMSGGVISGNGASDLGNGGGGGGGVVIAGTNSSFTMSDGTITNNTSIVGGGVAIAMDATGAIFNMTGGEITDNSASNNGGGVYLEGGNGTLTGDPSIGSKDSSKGSIYGNTAPTGPDVYPVP